MRWPLVVREALATAWASKVPSALVLMLVATMCAATLATVGRSAAAEEQLLARLDAAGSRVLTVTDVRGDDLISQTIVDQAAGMTTTERAIGAMVPVDVVSGVAGQGATRVPAWGIHGDMEAVATLTSGRWPGPGEAIVTPEAMMRLGLDEPVGWVAQASTTVVDDWSVVGVFTALEPFTDYGAGVLYVAPEGGSLSSVQVVLTSAEVAQVAQSQVLRLIDPPTLEAVAVTSPVSLAVLQGQVSGDLTAYGRTLLLGVLGAGAMLVAIVTFADVLVRRADLGRRRALGATRAIIVALVVLRTLVAALIGAAVGVGVGVWLSTQAGAGAAPVSFTAGIVVLALVAAIAAAVPPALYAATRDPVRVLRTP